MHTVVKRVQTGAALAAVVLLAAGSALWFVGNARFQGTMTVVAERVPVSPGDDALDRGRHLVDFLCRDCHGADLTGMLMFDEPLIATIHAANITGLGTARTDADLVRAIRHGIGADGRLLAIMPSDALVHLSREDLGAVIAYLRTVPRSGQARPLPHATALGKILLAAGAFGEIFAAKLVDHAAPFPPMPPIGANAATGEYLSRFCWGCHGESLAGGQPQDPASPPAPSLIGVGSWSEDDFVRFTRDGMTPAGRQVDSVFMPRSSLQRLSGDEIRGLYLYLRDEAGQLASDPH